MRFLNFVFLISLVSFNSIALTPDKIVGLGIAHVPEGRKIFQKLDVLENLELGAFIRRDYGAVQKDLEEIFELFPILKKRIRIIPAPEGVDSIENFVSVIVHPVRFKAIEVKNNEAIINAGSQSKAVLIGRFKKRLEEMQDILNQYFGIKNLTII